MPLSTRTRCFDGTLDRLRASDSGRDLSPVDVRQLRRLARSLCISIVDVYSDQVAAGEVGRGGSGRASAAAPTSQPTGLMYGRVQSGKTNGMVMASAAAIDNGFRVIVILTSDSTDLVDQTFERFGCVLGPLRYSSNETRAWRTERARMTAQIATSGLIFVCAKNGRHLPALLETLRAVAAENYPALIIDDEGDQATPDTTVAARARQRPNAPTHGSAVHRRTVRNDAPNELGDSLREYLRHNLLLQVTATPNALFLQNIDSPLRPSFTRLLAPGRGYCGGERFFQRNFVTVPPIAPPPPLVYVSETENLRLQAGAPAPDGLQAAALYFLVAATAYMLRGGNIVGGMKCLVHTSPRRDNHDIVAGLLRQLMADVAANRARYRPHLQAAYQELRRSLTNPPTFAAILNRLWQQLPGLGVHVVNANGSYGTGRYPDLYNFVVGGNVLGRGLTIKNLLVTYYSRMPVTAQMDTMLQHARMYGYREALMPYTRVFLPPVLATRFMQIHESETAERSVAESIGTRHMNVLVAGNLRPTRTGVLDPSMMTSYWGGQQIYSVLPYHSGAEIVRLCREFDRTIPARGNPRTLIPISLNDIEDIVRRIPVRPGDPGSWNREKILAALGTVRNAAGAGGQNAFLWYRPAPDRSGVNGLGSGVAGQRELGTVRASGAPVLMMFRISGTSPGWSGIDFWYPTLIFPGQTTVVFNRS